MPTQSIYRSVPWSFKLDFADLSISGGSLGRVGGRVAENSSGKPPAERQKTPILSGFAVVEPRGIEPLTSSLRRRWFRDRYGS
jgi:hypothetical protein